MNLAWIRKHYKVPAKRGMRVRYTGKTGTVQLGTITAARQGYLQVRLDGERKAKSYHPTWEIEYLPEAGREDEAK